jgi:hypothetical protein
LLPIQKRNNELTSYCQKLEKELLAKDMMIRLLQQLSNQDNDPKHIPGEVAEQVTPRSHPEVPVPQVQVESPMKRAAKSPVKNILELRFYWRSLYCYHISNRISTTCIQGNPSRYDNRYNFCDTSHPSKSQQTTTITVA